MDENLSGLADLSKPMPKSSVTKLEQTAIAQEGELSDQDPALDEFSKWNSLGQVLKKAFASPSPHDIPPEAQKIGRFPILRQLGRGGSGKVFLATDPDLGRSVAIKLLHSKLILSDELQDRFVQEGKILSELTHPNIISIYECGYHDDCPFLVFEYCPGGSLADWQATQQEDLSPQICAQLIFTLATAIHCVHLKGIVHRDVNPRNVLLFPLPEVDPANGNSELPYVIKLSDFGLGTWVDEHKTAVLTQTGIVMGTLPYMAPEQTMAATAVPQPTVDVYALGVMLYELLTRQRPFAGKTEVDTLRLIQQSDPIPPRQLRRTIPRDLETICLKSLDKSPRRRFPTAAALADDLERYLSGNAIHSRHVSLLEKSIRWVKKRPAKVTISAMVIILLFTITAGTIWFQQMDQHRKFVVDDFGKQVNSLNQAIDMANRNYDEIEARQRQEKIEQLERERRLIYNLQIATIAQADAARSYDAVQALRRFIPRPQDEIDLRGFEWYYLIQACGGDVASIPMTSESISAIRAGDETDSIFVASGKQLTEWDAQTGLKRRTISSFSDTIQDFAVSQQQKFLAIAVNKVPHVASFELNSGELIPRTNLKCSPRPWCPRLGLLADSRLLFSIRSSENRFRCQGQVLVHDIQSQKILHRPQWSKKTVTDVAIDHTNGTLIVGHDDHFVVVDFQDKQKQKVDLPNSPVLESICISPDCQKLAASTEDHRVELYTKNELGAWVFECELAAHPPVDWGPDKLVWRFRNPVLFRPDGQHLLSAFERELHLWQVSSKRKLRSMRQLPGAEVRGIGLLTDGKTVAWATEQVAGLWRPLDERPQVAGHLDEAWSVAFSLDGKLMATGSDDETVKIWDLGTGQQLAELKGHAATVCTLAFSPDGKTLATGSLDRTVKIWDVNTWELNHTLSEDVGAVRSLAWFADGKRIAISEYTRESEQLPHVLIWDVESQSVLHTLNGCTDCIHYIRISADQRLVVGGSNDHTVRIWNADTGSLIRTWETNGQVLCSTLMNNDQWLAVGYDTGPIEIWEIASGKQILHLSGHIGPVLTVAISPDGRSLASGGKDHTVRLWNVETEASLMVFDNHKSQINRVEFSPDGTILAACAHDGSVTLRYGPRFTPVLDPSTASRAVKSE